MILAAVLCLTIAVAGGFIVGVPVGIVLERERAARRPRERHEVLAEVYALPTPPEILAELRGPLSPGPHRPIAEARGDWWGV